MCRRYTLRANAHDLTEVFAALNEVEWTPRYNIAPTQMTAETVGGPVLFSAKGGCADLTPAIYNLRFQ